MTNPFEGRQPMENLKDAISMPNFIPCNKPGRLAARDRVFGQLEQNLLTKAHQPATLNTWANDYENFRHWLSQNMQIAPTTVRAATLLWFYLGVRSATLKAIEADHIQYVDDAEELKCWICKDKLLDMTGRMVTIGCCCHRAKDCCLIHGENRRAILKTTKTAAWKGVATAVTNKYSWITEHSMRRALAVTARRLIEAGDHCDLTRFLRDRGWLKQSTFTDYAVDAADWLHLDFPCLDAIWPAVLEPREGTSHSLRFKDRTGMTKITRAIEQRARAGEEIMPAMMREYTGETVMPGTGAQKFAVAANSSSSSSY
eukprot:g20857.t1